MQNNYVDQNVNRGGKNVEYAGFWVRLAAYCIDLAVVWIGLLFVKLVIGIMSMAGGGVFQARILFQYTLKDIILYVVQVLYFILLTYYTGTTIGKRLLNLRVTNADGSQKLELMNVIYRETIGRFLCGLSVGIGYIMAGVDREKKGLHDMLCDTRVIYGRKIKVFPKYQAPIPNNYPPIPPIPPTPPVPPYGGPMPPQGNMPGNGVTPMPPQGNTSGNGVAPQGNTQGNGIGQVPPNGNPLDSGIKLATPWGNESGNGFESTANSADSEQTVSQRNETDSDNKIMDE